MRTSLRRLLVVSLAIVLALGCLGGAALAQEGATRKIRLALQTNTNITDYEENYYTKLLETEGNVEFEFEFLPSASADVRNKIALMISGGSELPDVIVTGALDDASINEYGGKGVFLALDEWLGDEGLAKYFSQIPEEDRQQMMDDCRSADGHIYGLPRYAPSAWASTNKRLWINEAWLEKLGLAMPTTTDELYAVIEAFVTQDPNGNGIADELGVYGMSSNETILSLMNSFVYTGGLSDLALSDDGETVIAPFTSDGFRQGLAWMNTLYENGLLSENMFTDDKTTMIATMNGEINVVGVIGYGSFPTLWPNSAYGTNANVKEYDMLKPVTGPTGLAYAPHVNQNATARWFITKDAADPALCFEIGDLCYRTDIGLAARYGNKDNVITDLDELTAGGWTNSYKEMGIVDHLMLRINININATSTSDYWSDIGPRYASAVFDMSYSAIVENDDTTSNVSTFHGKNYLYNVFARPEYLLPTLKYTADEQSEIKDILANVNSSVTSNVAQFIIGGRDIETEWDSYLAELESMGLATYLETAQAAYERVK